MTDVNYFIENIRELRGGVARVDEYGNVYLDMPDGKVFELRVGVSSGEYGSKYIDAVRIK